MYDLGYAGFGAAEGPILRVSTGLYGNVDDVARASEAIRDVIEGIGGAWQGMEPVESEGRFYGSNLIQMPLLPGDTTQWVVSSAPIFDRRDVLLWEGGATALVSQLPGVDQPGGWREQVAEGGGWRKLGTVRYRPGQEAKYAELEVKAVEEEVAEPVVPAAAMLRGEKMKLIGGLLIGAAAVVTGLSVAVYLHVREG